MYKVYAPNKRTLPTNGNDKVSCFHPHGRSAEIPNMSGTSSSSVLGDYPVRTGRTSIL